MKSLVKATSTRRNENTGRSMAKAASVKVTSFAAAAAKYRGMLKDAPKDLSTREGFGRPLPR
ncbi:MAG: hypothetical protein WDM96_00600 [Lacunisphaera sp.]